MSERLGAVRRSCEKCGANPLELYRLRNGQLELRCWFCGKTYKPRV